MSEIIPEKLTMWQPAAIDDNFCFWVQLSAIWVNTSKLIPI